MQPRGRRSQRRLVEETRNIGIGQLRAAGYLVTGRSPPRNRLVVFRDGARVLIVWSQLKFGYRPWFECPSCKRRAGRLYTDGVRWLCRRCHNLAYRSQRNQPFERAVARAQAIRRRLGQPGWAGDPIPCPPLRMHNKTYARLVGELLDLENRALEVILDRTAPRLARLSSSLRIS